MARLIAILVCAAALSGCKGGEPPIRGWETTKTPVVPIRNMYKQPRYNTQAWSPFFADGRTMRPQVEGTVSREAEVSLEISTGQNGDGSAWVLTVPTEVVERNGGMSELVTRGRERYNIYCAPCHSLSGDGNGVVARRAEEAGASALKPPSFHDDRLRHIPDGQLFLTITNGLRSMPAYGYAVPVDDRWAIVTYVRALQLTQSTHATAMNRTGVAR